MTMVEERVQRIMAAGTRRPTDAGVRIEFSVTRLRQMLELEMMQAVSRADKRHA